MLFRAALAASVTCSTMPGSELVPEVKELPRVPARGNVTVSISTAPAVSDIK